MKRSDVLRLINREIEGYMSPGAATRVSEKILRIIEEVGMLPPLTTKEVKKEIDGSLFEYIYDANEWEIE